MLLGAQRQTELLLATDGRVCSNGLPRPITNTAAVSNIARFAGPDPNPADNAISITVTPVDTTPPVIESVTATPGQLWPPDHKMVLVTVSPQVTDLCDTAPVCRITGVTSNEAINGPGDGSTAPDWEIIENLALDLRAERSGTGSGRRYSVATECKDASGNKAMATVKVLVPKSEAQ